MISNEGKSALIEQMGRELEASMIYLRMSYDMSGIGMLNWAKWFREQSDEEREHMLKMADFLDDLGFPVPIPAAVAQPSERFKSIKDALTASLQLEQKVTGFLSDIGARACQKGDMQLFSLMIEFMPEQVKSEGFLNDALAALALDISMKEFDEWVDDHTG